MLPTRKHRQSSPPLLKSLHIGYLLQIRTPRRQGPIITPVNVPILCFRVSNVPVVLIWFTYWSRLSLANAYVSVSDILDSVNVV